VTRRRVVLATLAVVAAMGVGYAFAGRPSNDRDWVPNEAVLPAAEFAGESVVVRNVRNTIYRGADDFTPAYYDATYDLTSLRRVWFGVVPFTGSTAMAHTFLSFEFAGPRFVAISVEARKERGEGYGPVKGLFRRFELMYVVADERDAIGLRAVHRRDTVYLYPIRASPDRVRELLRSMLAAANDLRAHPRFYNTLTANCTATIVRHVNALVPGRVPFSYRWLLPGYADGLAFDLGLIDTEVPRDSLRARFRVTAAGTAWADSASFSTGIRRGLPAPVGRRP
jgi:uncharacterized protein DUF4105